MQTTSPSRKWFPFRRALPEAHARLFCIPYAGGSASAFRAWANRVAHAYEVCAVEPPGRGSRYAEPPLVRVRDYVSALVPVIRDLSDKPFAIFGHSLGATIAFEVARQLAREHGPRPTAVILSGHGLKDSDEEPVSRLSDAELVQRLRGYGGTPPELLENAELLEIVLPVLRADFEMVETHEFDSMDRLDVPLLALGGTGDERVPETSLRAWSERTSGPFRLKMFPGGHFFLSELEDEVVATIRTFVDEALRYSRGGKRSEDGPP